ncbi:MAG: DUF1559 domain-containing protein [Planctomycetaceae bacterium]|nr:DUF1559 domain-containing protein [Planctomycetaceae bacterium]
MPISYSCPHCGKQFSVADQFAGQSGPCAGCGQTITIPGMPMAGYKYAPPAAGSGMGGGTVALIVVLGILVLMCPCGIALLLPAVQAAREAARRTSSANNLKQIGIAIHNYHDTHGAYPPAVVTDANGTPLYSGRVLLLPFIEQATIYDQWDKSAAWDSPQNIELSNIMLKVFDDPSAQGHSHYEFVTGPGAMFEAGSPHKFGDITDGLANTIAVVEMRTTNPSWAAPSSVDINQLAAGLPQGNHPGGGQILLADGSVRFVAQSINPQTLRALATRKAGDSVGGF